MESLVGEYELHINQLLQNKSVIIAAVTVILSALYYIFKTRGLPPGPTGLPILGYWPFLKNETCHFTLQNLQKKYGDIFCFNYAGAFYLNLGSVKVMREAHINKGDCFDRPSDFSLLNFVLEDALAMSNGESWKVIRKFTVSKLREYGMTTVKDTMSGALCDNIKETIQYLRSKKGEPVEMIQLLTDKCNSILRQTMFGDNGITEQEVRELNKCYGEVMSFMTVKNTLHSGNLAKYVLLPLAPGYSKAVKQHKQMMKQLQVIVNRHKSTFDEEHPQNFIHAYFKERNERMAKDDPTAEYFTDKALVSNLVQYIGDGVLAIATFAAAFLKYVVDHKDEQEKIYLELIEVVGHERDPSIEDKSKLVYTNAFIYEILRMSDFFPMFPSLQCIKETSLCGYRIPKGSITLMNTWGCHYNPSVYEEPEKFNPSRYIAKNGKERAELPITFGVGKRACIGEGFTMAQVFLFLATIIKHFKLSVPENSNYSAFEILMGQKMEFLCDPRNKLSDDE